MKVMELMPQEQIHEYIVQEILDVTVSHAMEEATGVVKLVPHDRVRHRTVEETVDLEEIVERFQLVPQECIPACIIEQTVDVSVSQIREPSVDIVKVIRKRARTVEQIIDMPVPQILEETVEVHMPVVVQHQVPMFNDDAGQDPEKHLDEDEVYKIKMEAMNHLENHCVAVRNIHILEELKVKFEAGDNEKPVHDALDQVDKNPFAE